MPHDPAPPRAWLDGEALPDQEIGAPAPALFAGIGADAPLFESLRWPETAPGEFDAHLERMRAAARLLRRPFPASLGRWRPPGQPPAGQGTLRISLSPAGRWRAWLGPDLLIQPPALTLSPPIPLALPPTVKHHARQPWEEAERAAGGELLFHEGGFLLETSRANVLARINDTIWTPPLDGRVLPGCTRARVLREAAQVGLTVREAPLPIEFALQPDPPLWITSSLRGLVRVGSVRVGSVRVDEVKGRPPGA